MNDVTLNRFLFIYHESSHYMPKPEDGLFMLYELRDWSFHKGGWHQALGNRQADKALMRLGSGAQ